ETWKWKLLGSDAYRGGSGIPLPGLMHHVIDGALEIDTGNDVQIIEAGGSGRAVTAGGYRYRAHAERSPVCLTVALPPRLPRCWAARGAAPIRREARSRASRRPVETMGRRSAGSNPHSRTSSSPEGLTLPAPSPVTCNRLLTRRACAEAMTLEQHND